MLYEFELYDDNDKVGKLEVFDKGNRYEWIIIVKPFKSFCGMVGNVSKTEAEDWVYERIIPKTRINIEENLIKMGLQEYDEVDILSFTEGRSVRDNYWVKRLR